MKNILLVTAVLASSSVLAQGVISPVDYSQCQQALGFFGPQLNHKGESIAVPGMQPNPDVSTTKLQNDETETTYSFKTQLLGVNGKPQIFKYKIKKDKNGNVIEVNTTQDKIDAITVSMHKQWALNSAVYSGIAMDSLAYDPIVMITPPSPENVSGEFTYVSKLSKTQAKNLGVDLDDLKKLKKQSKKDQKTLSQITGGYSKLLDKSQMMIPNGANYKMQVVDGVCKPIEVTLAAYNVKTKVNHDTQSLNRTRCDHVLKVQKKYEQKLNECANTNFEMLKEMNQQGGVAGGVNGGYSGGEQGGIDGGAAGGFGMGMGGGYGFNSEVINCQQYFGQMPQGGWGSTSGSGGGLPYNSGNTGFGIGSGQGVGF
jgi:hypothetical protein